VCECYHRSAGFIYQYYDAIEQDVEGSLDIVTGQEDSQEVVSGLCQDFFEFRMVNHKSCAVAVV